MHAVTGYCVAFVVCCSLTGSVNVTFLLLRGSFRVTKALDPVCLQSLECE